MEKLKKEQSITVNMLYDEKKAKTELLEKEKELKIAAEEFVHQNFKLLLRIHDHENNNRNFDRLIEEQALKEEELNIISLKQRFKKLQYDTKQGKQT